MKITAIQHPPTRTSYEKPCFFSQPKMSWHRLPLEIRGEIMRHNAVVEKQTFKTLAIDLESLAEFIQSFSDKKNHRRQLLRHLYLQAEVRNQADLLGKLVPSMFAFLGYWDSENIVQRCETGFCLELRLVSSCKECGLDVCGHDIGHLFRQESKIPQVPNPIEIISRGLPVVEAIHSFVKTNSDCLWELCELSPTRLLDILWSLEGLTRVRIEAAVRGGIDHQKDANFDLIEHIQEWPHPIDTIEVGALSHPWRDDADVQEMEYLGNLMALLSMALKNLTVYNLIDACHFFAELQRLQDEDLRECTSLVTLNLTLRAMSFPGSDDPGEAKAEICDFFIMAGKVCRKIPSLQQVTIFSTEFESFQVFQYAAKSGTATIVWTYDKEELPKDVELVWRDIADQNRLELKVSTDDGDLAWVPWQSHF
ncbi:hypothetical protein EDB81DRAFT_948579 [Dactylonectria macrodidyma]|uniref:DUF6546 domain-containing protein n=1 Tax=Dactylonectria macrodidyma TaxID=307937 RepID=A0A9P9J0I7_9HYPO|nr:hypothetical protein EDB81DRAFT_948579 [Dactylonectria macrodidyma]